MIELTLTSVRSDEDENTIEDRKKILCENIIISGRYIYMFFKGMASRLDTSSFDYFTIREVEEEK